MATVATTASYFLPIIDEKILMLKRINTGYEDGKYSLVAGHCEKEESAEQTFIREVWEEAGISVNPKDVTPVHILHRNAMDHYRVDFFFTASHWEGEIKNREPDKCADLRWFSLNDIPVNTIDYVRFVIEQVKAKQFYSEYGWKNL